MTKQADKAEAISYIRNAQVGTMHVTGLPPYEKPRAYKVLRSRAGMSLVQSTCGGFAAGKLRVGAEIPRGVTIYKSLDDAIAEYLGARND